MKQFPILALLLLTGCTTTSPQADYALANAQASYLLSYAALATDAPTPAPPDPNPDAGTKPEPETSIMRPKLDTPYSKAQANHISTGRPLLVIVGAEWCAPCVKLKAALPAYRDAGVLDGVELAILDWEKDTATAQAVIGRNASLPTLKLFWFDGDAKRAAVHVGAIDGDGLKRFLKR